MSDRNKLVSLGRAQVNDLGIEGNVIASVSCFHTITACVCDQIASFKIKPCLSTHDQADGTNEINVGTQLAKSGNFILIAENLTYYHFLLQWYLTFPHGKSYQLN